MGGSEAEHETIREKQKFVKFETKLLYIQSTVPALDYREFTDI